MKVFRDTGISLGSLVVLDEECCTFKSGKLGKWFSDEKNVQVYRLAGAYYIVHYMNILKTKSFGFLMMTLFF